MARNALFDQKPSRRPRLAWARLMQKKALARHSRSRASLNAGESLASAGFFRSALERFGLERVGAEWHVKRGALAIRDGHEIGLPEIAGLRKARQDAEAFSLC